MRSRDGAGQLASFGDCFEVVDAVQQDFEELFGEVEEEAFGVQAVEHHRGAVASALVAEFEAYRLDERLPSGASAVVVVAVQFEGPLDVCVLEQTHAQVFEGEVQSDDRQEDFLVVVDVDEAEGAEVHVYRGVAGDVSDLGVAEAAAAEGGFPATLVVCDFEDGLEVEGGHLHEQVAGADGEEGFLVFVSLHDEVEVELAHDGPLDDQVDASGEEVFFEAVEHL